MPLFDENGKVKVCDIAERIGLLQALEPSLAQRYDNRVSMLMRDIDFFKGINHTYGHKAGNLVLQRLAGDVG